MKITWQTIEEWKTPAGGWTRAQIELLCLPWPNKHGWMHELIGKEITDELFQKVMDAKNIRAKAWKKIRQDSLF